ncbi:uncharacterized protein T551_01423 [Pneumocystis jirovecii RU7]|uniref:Uncharacterized protein n=1 Tax=Pneumocystis jirovecii (strain RU7) TaxID=1408657 RepID=A0A0W4ZSJ0_PNEJ7|nr:uncharacterized protein T551_01423 [Pneumocystis jirovecii RU7]KTW31351.1 hypothetical protein T551_01423 [Pneumocystis jirovecii RU7]
MEFLKNPIIIQLSPIKHLAPSDPSKKLKRVLSYEHNKKRKIKKKDSEDKHHSSSNSIVYKYDNKRSNKENIKKNTKKNKNINIEKKNILILNSETKEYNNCMKLKQNTPFSSQENNTKNIKQAYLSNSTSPISKTLALQEEFIWDTENNVSYNISSDDYSLLSLSSDYDKSSTYKKLKNSDDSWILF